MFEKFIVGMIALSAITSTIVLGVVFNVVSHIPHVNVGGPTVVTSTASSTKVTIGTTAIRVLATSSKRTALTIQPVNCPTGSTLFFNFGGKDATSTIYGNFAVNASTTQEFSDQNLPVDPYSVRAIANQSCDAIITEWRSNF